MFRGNGWSHLDAHSYQPGESFTYRRTHSKWYFLVPSALTTSGDGGLSNPVVEDPAEPVVDEDLVLIFDSANEQTSSSALGTGR